MGEQATVMVRIPKDLWQEVVRIAEQMERETGLRVSATAAAAMLLHEAIRARTDTGKENSK